jgi:hypothetical protein
VRGGEAVDDANPGELYSHQIIINAVVLILCRSWWKEPVISGETTFRIAVAKRI